MSAESLRFHHLLYSRYVQAVNAEVDVASIADGLLAAEEARDERLREQVAQVHNHVNFFASMAPPGEGGEPTPRLAAALRSSVGTKRSGIYAWATAAASVFGSGWVWLVADPSGAVRIETTRNAGIPRGRPLLVMDVWEHAYYLDYPAERKAYAEVWLRGLPNWSRASAIYDSVTA
jgi:Fe-Mn family superoxide dismutase